MLFDWFKLNSYEFALQIQRVETAELTRNILIDWIPIFEDKQVDYDIDIPEQPVRVRLDMDSYMRIINNLIQNVIAHSHTDKIKISLSKKENSMELLLADNGVGIEKEDLKHHAIYPFSLPYCFFVKIICCKAISLRQLTAETYSPCSVASGRLT